MVGALVFGLAIVAAMIVRPFATEQSAERKPSRNIQASPEEKQASNTKQIPAGVVHIKAIGASSTMPAGHGYSYKPTNLIDGDLTTSWQPIRSDRSPRFHFEFTSEAWLRAITIANGFQTTDKNGDEFTLNSRIATAEVRFSNGTTFVIQFDSDTRGRRRFELPPTKTSSLDVVVLSQHRGTRWLDLAVSEVELEMSPD